MFVGEPLSDPVRGISLSTLTPCEDARGEVKEGTFGVGFVHCCNRQLIAVMPLTGQCLMLGIGLNTHLYSV